MLAECRHTPLVFGPGFCVLAFYIQQGRLCTVGADLAHELVRDKLVKVLGSEVMESVMLQSSFEGALAPQKVRWFLRFIVFVLDFGVLWIRAKGRHTYPSSGAFETQCVLYDPGHLLSLSHSTRPEVRLYCFWYRFCTCCGKRRCRLRDGTATSSSLAFSFFLWYAVLVLYLGFVLRWMLAVYRHIPHLRDAFGNTVRWLWVLASVSAFNKVGSLFW